MLPSPAITDQRCRDPCYVAPLSAKASSSYLSKPRSWLEPIGPNSIGPARTISGLVPSTQLWLRSHMARLGHPTNLHEVRLKGSTRLEPLQCYHSGPQLIAYPITLTATAFGIGERHF